MNNTTRPRGELLAPKPQDPVDEVEVEADSPEVIAESDDEQASDDALATTAPDALEGHIVSVSPSDLGIAEHLAKKFINDGPAVVFTEGAFFNWAGAQGMALGAHAAPAQGAQLLAEHRRELRPRDRIEKQPLDGTSWTLITRRFVRRDIGVGGPKEETPSLPGRGASEERR